MPGMKTPDFTTVVAVDANHLEDLRLAWPTWRKHKPEILERPLLVIADAMAGDARDWRLRLAWLDHPSRSIALWDWPNRDDSEMAGVTQAERMFTAFVHVPPAVVTTAYWMKLDVDTIATSHGDWLQKKWFRDRPTVIASPWGYTKPAKFVDDLNRWARGVSGLSELDEKHRVTDPAARHFRSPRWCSWLAFLDTTWSRYASGLAPGRLPCPSQDTYHWYIADRRGDRVVTAKMKRHGWNNCSGRRRRQQLAREALA